MRGRGRHHHHPGPGGPGFFGPGPAIGIWGGGRFCRRGPPPVFGRHGYYYNYPGLVLGTALVGAAAVGYAANTRHVYVRNRQQITVVNPPTNVRRYYVDIPADVYPGETFRVVLDGEEVIITCPDVSGPGERIIVCVEVGAVAAPAPVVASTVQPQAARIVQYNGAPVNQVPASAPSQPQYQQQQQQQQQGYREPEYAPVAVPTATPVGSSGGSVSPFSGVSALPAPSATATATAAATAPAAAAAAASVPLSPDVISCPQCTFFNPSIGRFCQMCGTPLKSA